MGFIPGRINNSVIHLKISKNKLNRGSYGGFSFQWLHHVDLCKTRQWNVTLKEVKFNIQLYIIYINLQFVCISDWPQPCFNWRSMSLIRQGSLAADQSWVPKALETWRQERQVRESLGSTKNKHGGRRGAILLFFRVNSWSKLNGFITSACCRSAIFRSSLSERKAWSSWVFFALLFYS